MDGLDVKISPSAILSHCKDHHGAVQPEVYSNCEPVPFPIAIVGMSMRLPGGVNGEKELWDLLINKRDGRCIVPEDRYNIEAFYDETRPGAIRTQHGYFLQQDISQVDAGFFGMSKLEAGKLDPQQRILLEVVWECLENGGQLPSQCRGKDIGCYVGVFGEDWLDLMSKDTQAIDRFRVVSAADFALSNRVSYEYDLRGPSITFRTGCSAALVGLHDACQALYTGECSSALVAGTNLIITPTTTNAVSETMALSPDGISKTFDASADGYGRGEAVNAIYIKPLHACLRDGDPIRAVIRSTAVNCDGKTPSITTPGSQAQEALIRKAYQKAGISDISKTAFFECHGTGTIVGDTAETTVIANVFGHEGIHIGAVKPNLGHSEGASGITSVIKSVLALEHRILPPNIHFNTPNPNIPFKEAKLQVPVDPTPWPAGRCERISVNSFGIGGTNAHVVLDSALSVGAGSQSGVASDERPGPPHILLASAKSATSLDSNIRVINDYLHDTPSAALDLAYTLAFKREHMQHRAFAIVEKDGNISTFEKARAINPQICFVFTGQGAQWPGMGREMILSSEKFRRFQEAKFAQPLCTAIQVALVDFLRELGAMPSIVVGHSSGEIAAAYASGAITAASAIKIAYFRGLAMESANGNGAMAAVSLGRAEAEKYLKNGVVVACENSPESVTISGDEQAVDEMLKDIQAQGEVFCRRLAVNVAYHSHHMKEVGELFESLLSEICFNESMTPLVSTVTNETISDPCALSPSYWRRNVENPVMFNTALSKILSDDEKALAFVEIGPHSVLSGPLRQIISGAASKRNCSYIPTFVRHADQSRCLLSTAGHIHALGVSIDLSMLVRPAATVTDLAPYSWDHTESFWSETRLTRDWRLRSAPHHELLGSRALESSDLEPVWRNMLQAENVPWLLEHKIGGEVVFPGAGYVAMVGEAMRQISQIPEYSVKNVFMRAALVLKEAKLQHVEIITSLRPVKLTDSLDSGWYDFTITAYNEGEWKKHCVGQVRAEPEGFTNEYGTVSPYSRKVLAKEWYDALEKRGLEYGPNFRGLRDITASPTTTEAAATLYEPTALTGSRYALHPVVMDQCLQLLSVAGAKGIQRSMTQLCIPTAIESLYVAPGREMMSLKSTCDAAGNTFTGDALLLADGWPVLSLRRCFFFGISESAINDENGASAATLHWKPHIDFLPLESLIPPISADIDRGRMAVELTNLFILEAYHRTRSSRPTKEHLKNYHKWLSSQYERIKSEDPRLVLEMDNSGSNPEGCLSQIEELGESIEHSLVRSVYTAGYEMLSHIEGILDDSVDALEVISGSDAVSSMYQESSRLFPAEKFLSLLSHSRPTLRVLEVGAGTGGATSAVLDALYDATKHEGPLYSSYTFTDISAGFFAKAKEHFRNFPGMIYETFDISKDPEDQGFAVEGYDLIIASNVVHATPRISTSLRNLNKLLAPGGWLFLTELCPGLPMINFIMGTLPGWWNAEDLRETPVVPVSRWHQELLDAGFTGADIVRYDNEPPYETNAYMLSRRPEARASLGKEIGFLHRGKAPKLAYTLAKAFTHQGVKVTWLTLNDMSSSITNVISFLDLDSPFLDSLSEDEFCAFQRFLSGVKGHCLWLMPPVQLGARDSDPRFGLTLGLMRTVRKELSTNFATFELDQKEFGAADKVALVYERICRQSGKNPINEDYEFALKDGAVHVGRFHFQFLHQMMAADDSFEQRSLDIGCFGIFDSLTWALDGRVGHLGEHDIEVDIRFVGLNFRDIMISMGLMGETSEIGLEAAGIVRNVGSGVQNIQVGDKVSVFGTGLMGTRKIVPANTCLVLPEGLSLEDAAAGPCVFSTALYSLVKCGNLQKGQTVLIHSACGGVGLAAIQICQAIGAEIFATVGSKEKREHLMEEFNLTEDRIFDSRSVSFHKDVMKATSNRGVDLVLNSLSGELLHASWKCVAPMGKMIELGKRDFLGHGKLDMDLFMGNRTFIGVDLLQIGEQNPEVIRSLVQQFAHSIEQGKLRPIRPVTVFKASDIAKAFRHMQTGKHMGKILVEMPENPADLRVSKLQARGALFRGDASYLLVGGLGGLGRAVARWMVEKGAQHLLFMSRSGLEPIKAREFVQDMESQGNCHIQVVTGDVTSISDVERAVSAAVRPIAGIMQLSMVLRDQTLDNMAYEEWIEALAPKVQGTRNVHQATQDCSLDFFVLLSSVSGTAGHIGQANYAAANTFLDAFVTYRHSKGLPASVLDIGFMGDIGVIAETSHRAREMVEMSSWEILEEHDLLKALEIQIMGSAPQLALGMGTTKPVSEMENGVTVGQDARFLAWHNMLTASDGGSASQDNELKTFVNAIKRNPSLLYDPATETKITLEIGRMVASNMSYPDDMPYEELCEIAIDSLMTIEIRSWFRRNVGVEVSLAQISKAQNVKGLGAITMQVLREKHKSGELENAKGSLVGNGKDDVDESVLYRADLELAKSLEPISEHVPYWHSESEGRVFVTGCTGFLGAFFLSTLTRHPRVKEIACLVRAPDAAAGLARIKENMEHYGLSLDSESKVIVVPGDLTDSTLGLGQEKYEHFAQWTSVIFHLAAQCNYMPSYSELRGANIHGFSNILRFANTKRLKPVHYTSSISACGTSAYLEGRELIGENERPALNTTDSERKLVGYSETKIVAESIAWDAIANGMPVTIHRLPVISGHSKTGVANPGDGFQHLMVSSIRVGCYPSPPAARCQMIPVDYASSAILEIALSSHHSHAYNLVLPDQTHTLTWDEVLDMVAHYTSPPLKRVSALEWADIVATHGEHHFKVASAFLQDKVRQLLVYWEAETMTKTVYENANSRRVLLASSDMPELPSMPELLSTYFKVWQKEEQKQHR
ncbi:polyketide synthase [Aspergillus costaricaensis CBS 115574]|uniref:Polyketide synthase n=1 Tax=Aspergillus costaricaensis CBS 115574 TaxID=1448317 RepID=A0ACD1IJK9_9EURO|nr:polyketide synthase [Aspergillus costaricaensis CBS 115574]RAK90795.1 polyketide synthase [Aspergillus costaricaensis CBS 115574]